MNRSSAGAEEVARRQRTDLTQSADLTLTKRTGNYSVLWQVRSVPAMPNASARRTAPTGRCCSRCRPQM